MGAPPDGLVPLRAALALGMSLGQVAERVKNLWVLVELMEATATYVRAAPWVHRSSDDPVEVTLSGALTGRFEGSIMGGGGDAFGMTLYTDAGAIARVAALVEQGRMREAARFDSLAVTIEDAAPLAADAIRTAFGVSAAPLPVRMRKGRGEAVREEEALALAATLRAAAGLSPERYEATASAEVDDLRVEAHVATPASERTKPPAARTAFRPAVARNAPCPCGSGRKYKKCHLPLEEAASQPADADLHERDQRLVGVLVAYAKRRLGDRWGIAVAAGYPPAFDDEASRLQLVVPWSVYECRVDGRTVLEWYLDERGRRLEPPDREWLEAQRRAWLSVWEVQQVEPGVGAAVRDLLTGERRRVSERSGTRSLARREAVLARVVDAGDRAVFCGCHPGPLPPREADRVVAAVRRKLRLGARKAAGEQLKAPGATEVLIAKWEAALKTLARRPAPHLVNSDQEPLLLTVDHFEHASAARGEVERLLAAVEGAQGPDRDGDVTGFAVVRPGNAIHGEWDNTILGTITVREEGLRIETNSLPRADRIRELVTQACGNLIAHRGRTHTDPSAALAQGGAPSEPSPMPAEAAGVLRAFKERHYAQWLDDALPALRGSTPRAAVRTASGRRQVHVLLKEIERGESRLPEGERCDVDWLRRELGLVAE